jgi:hypothetical protein
MNALKPLPSLSVIPSQTRRLPGATAVTIGIGFQCVDGVVLCADTQITAFPSYKKHECKLYKHVGKGWSVAFAFAGNSNLMKAFDAKFAEGVTTIQEPFTVQKIGNRIEGVLLSMDVILNDSTGLHMVCAVAVPPVAILLKTEGQIVRGLNADRFYSFVGAGDSSVLQHLGSLLAQAESGTCTIDQAYALGIYLVAQAKAHVPDCAGDIDIIIVRSSGEVDQRGVSVTHGVEQQLLILEHYIGKVASAFFDRRIKDVDFDKLLVSLCNKLREAREPSQIWPVLP